MATSGVGGGADADLSDGSMFDVRECVEIVEIERRQPTTDRKTEQHKIE
jgi:hypothetical protein